MTAFESAARHLSFLEAADELGRTPSAISHSIRSLEAQLDVQLFLRVGRTVQLTDLGAVYCDAVRGALQTLDKATQAARRPSNKDCVTISALPFFTSTVLLPNLAKFEATNPGLELKIETSNSFADILNGEADIALRFGEKNAKGLMCEPLLNVSGLPVASQQYLERSPELTCPDDLAHHDLIHDRPQQGSWKRWLERNGVQAQSTSNYLMLDSILSAIDAAENGHGIMLAMDPLIRLHPSFGNRLFPLLSNSESLSLAYNFVCQEKHWETPRIQKAYRWLKDCAAAALQMVEQQVVSASS